MLFLFLRGENRTNGLSSFILQNVHAWLGSTGTGPACHAAGMMVWVVGRPIMKCYPNKRSVLICMTDFRLYLNKCNRYISEILQLPRLKLAKINKLGVLLRSRGEGIVKIFKFDKGGRSLLGTEKYGTKSLPDRVQGNCPCLSVCPLLISFV